MSIRAMMAAAIPPPIGAPPREEWEWDGAWE